MENGIYAVMVVLVAAAIAGIITSALYAVFSALDKRTLRRARAGIEKFCADVERITEQEVR